MMMSRPQPKTGKVAPEEAAEPVTKPKTSGEHVQDLERRLAMLGSVTTPVQPVAKEEPKPEVPPPAFAISAAETKPEIKAGKTALLARIMAAQEKAKAAAKKPEPAPPVDLLDDSPPPAFDETILPPPAKEEAPPPPFDTVEQQADPPPSFDVLEDQPPAYEEMKDTAPPAPMAPAYEDLLDHAEQQNSLENIEPMQAPSMEEEIMGMEGLSEEERHALIEEQRQIMAQIEQERQANAQAIANAQADAFDQRSAPAVARAASDAPTRTAMHSTSEAPTRTVDLGGGQQVALHGQERTRAAIEDGTAILVQCIHCQNWMQVTDTATLMYCPVCSVVSPVERQTAVLTKEEAMQLSADRRMAEQLQQEEYADQEEEEEEESWWDSVTSLFVSKNTGPARPQPQQVSPKRRGEIGVSLPPGSIPERSGGLVAARTGNEEETITFSNSFEEREGLLLNNENSGMPRARVAERQPLFSCVVDSVSTAASSVAGALTSTTLSEDSEGNVHGVDSSSLLAVTRASRGIGGEDQEYQPLN